AHRRSAVIDTARGRRAPRTILSGAAVVLPDRILHPGTVVIEEGRIASIEPGDRPAGSDPGLVDCRSHFILPGFIDVHVHGVEGADALDGPDGVSTIAARLPRYGVTAFCPTSIACAPGPLRTMLAALRAERHATTGARVLPAHLESNFINPDYCGAQPVDCLRLPRGGVVEGAFTGADILTAIHAAKGDVGIMTVAPELDGAIDLIADLVAAGIYVSLGHSGATYEQAFAGIEAGATQATHLFNRMTPLGHRAPGLAAAVLDSERVTAEIICDGVHVHPAMLRIALAAKGPDKIMAITDGTAGSGLAVGTRSFIGDRPITVGDVARLDDGTIAGSTLTMDQAFRNLVRKWRLSVLDAARSCATTPAEALGLVQAGRIAEGWIADLAILDEAFEVRSTYIGGELAWTAGP
ncbi:MAG TPA: N-acetylglucosamine-6-phosphate deacetylase, partial [Gemmatimonadales bacterium]|nr:N-acetylglucosamine-6-phosphate deacetylase [Gemmatimonadales bacterium]